MKREEIEAKIAEYAVKLTQLNGPESKRVKKRVLQALGKLKKQLSEAGGVTSTKSSEGEAKATTSFESNQQCAALSQQPLSRKQLKSKLKLLNKELAEYATKKQLKLAKKRFNWGVKKGMEPDKHTFANMINCHVRCGDMEGALAQLLAMTSRSHLSPNIVIYTTLLKGYCDTGDLMAAKQLLFNELQQAGLEPTVRTINTFIRGCSKVGAVHSALRAFRQGKSAKSTSGEAANSHTKKRKRPASRDDDGDEDEGDEEEDGDGDDDAEGDAGPSSAGTDRVEGQDAMYEQVVALLCQGLLVPEASRIAMEAVAAAELSSGAGNSTDSASMYVNLAKACAMTGQWTEADKWLECASTAMASSKTFFLRQSMQQKFQVPEDDEGCSSRSAKAVGTEQHAKRGRSVDLFLRHRRAELESELECWQAFSSSVKIGIQKGARLSQPEFSSDSAKCGLYRALSRVLMFGYDGTGDYDSVDGRDEGAVPISGLLVFALRDKFGLDRIEKLADGPSDSGRHGNVESSGLAKSLKGVKKEVVKKVLRSVPDGPGYIDYSALFDPSAGGAGGPIHLEICSGSGDWVVAHAAADMHLHRVPGTPAKARWLALELRCDRVYHTLCKSIAMHWDYCSQMSKPVADPFGGLPNLAILGGDASKILPDRITPESIAAVYINHPQPPERTSGEGDSQGQHLLTQPFFGQIHRVLASTGTVTIVTDNLPYGESLVRALAKSAYDGLLRRARGEPVVAFVSSPLPPDSTGRRTLQEVVAVSATSVPRTADKGKSLAPARAMHSGVRMQDTDSEEDKDEEEEDEVDGQRMFSDNRNAGYGGRTKPATIPSSGVHSKAKTDHPAATDALHLELWRGDSEDCGPGGRASSSYFDRLWERGQKKRRWFIVLRKL